MSHSIKHYSLRVEVGRDTVTFHAMQKRKGGMTFMSPALVVDKRGLDYVRIAKFVDDTRDGVVQAEES